MVKIMNKTQFIDKLTKETKLTREECEEINNILEENFIIGKKNKEIIISNLMERLDIDNKKANELYNIVSSIITKEIKNKIFHPFKSKD